MKKLRKNKLTSLSKFIIILAIIGGVVFLIQRNSGKDDFVMKDYGVFEKPEQRMEWWENLDNNWKMLLFQSLDKPSDEKIAEILNQKSLLHETDNSFDFQNLDGIKYLKKLETLAFSFEEANMAISLKEINQLNNLKKLVLGNCRLKDLDE